MLGYSPLGAKGTVPDGCCAANTDNALSVPPQISSVNFGYPDEFLETA